ncbi:MAG: FecR family protein [Kofleriaceae bacterium]|nr:FecR family protein [Kofleriaceae bacterium]
MSRHVAPEVWADAFAGRLADDERATIEAHAKTCAKCARTRARVGSASDSFASIRTQAAPELPWDSVRARVHWTVSKERRAQPAPRASRFALPRPVWVAFGLAAVGGLGVVVATQLSSSAPTRTPAAPIAEAPPVRAPEAPIPVTLVPEPLAGLVNRASGEVLIDARSDELFARRLVAGSVIATGGGSVDVQFGDGSAFALGPRSTLELRRFDAELIELAVTGTLDVEVAPRKPGQRFLVVAGEHTVEVRGTQFRVEYQPTSTRVACRHGLVAVRGRSAQVDVGPARGLRLEAGAAITSDRVAPLTVDELNTLAEATPFRLPLWDLDALARSSAPLEVSTVTAREVRVDGVELGRAPLAVRVMPGRHTVEATDSAGRYRRAGWVDVAAPRPGARAARLEVPAEPAPTAGIAARKKELRTGIDGDRLANCTRSIAKAGLSGTYVQIEITVDSGGAVGFLNIVDTDLPSSTARCVREALADVRFRVGAAATWRERIDL